MKESPIFAEIEEEARVETAQSAVLEVLDARFGRQAAAACRDAVLGVNNKDKLRRLVRLAARCTDVEAFQRGLRTR